MQSRELAARFEAYGDWRRRLSSRHLAVPRWLEEQDLADAQVDLRVQQMLERLHQDKLVVAFVAEFSRGKSELINAIFFADFGQRLLPSSAGRTTMCPTELLHDPSRPPSIRLLPIETRLKDATVAEFKNYADEWVTLPLDLSSAERMGEALSRVSQVKRVPFALARRYGLTEDSEDVMKALTQDEQGSVDIPCWRHAIINFPHPLLQQGLVILDTPGLNAIGTEPELTLSLLPQAHAILFILAADAGVTRTDLEVWNQHLAGEDAAAKDGRIVDPEQDRRAVGRLEASRRGRGRDRAAGARERVDARRSRSQVFAVSAQKALLAKVNGDDALLAKSRLPALEGALSGRMIPAKRDIVGNAAKAEVRSLADERARDCSTRGSRASPSSSPSSRRCAARTRTSSSTCSSARATEKELFERGLARFTALRNVFTKQTNALFDQIGLEALRANARRTRKAIEASPFTKGVRAGDGRVLRDDPRQPRRRRQRRRPRSTS